MTKQLSGKRKLILIFSVIILSVLIIAGTLIYNNFLQGERPFEDLAIEDVKCISLYSQNATQEIIYTFTDDECEKIVKFLKGIAIGKEDNQSYVGGFDREFRLEKTDGTIIEFGTNANFWLDGQRYEVPENNISLIELNKIHTEYYQKHYIPYNAQN